LQILTVELTSHNDVPKLHLIARQRSCLICQNILNLPQFLINADSPALETTVIDRAEHFSIIRHEIPLKNFDELQRDNETDGDESGIKDEI